MRRKSRAEELMKDAEGSDALYGGMTGSNDMAAGCLPGARLGGLV